MQVITDGCNLASKGQEAYGVWDGLSSSNCLVYLLRLNDIVNVCAEDGWKAAIAAKTKIVIGCPELQRTETRCVQGPVGQCMSRSSPLQLVPAVNGALVRPERMT